MEKPSRRVYLYRMKKQMLCPARPPECPASRLNRQGHFQFGLVSGNIDSLETKRDGQPAVEWSREGIDEMNALAGRLWMATNFGV